MWSTAHGIATLQHNRMLDTFDEDADAEPFFGRPHGRSCDQKTDTCEKTQLDDMSASLACFARLDSADLLQSHYASRTAHIESEY